MSLVGRQIGRYRILEEVGSGGMSVVYKGVDTALDREVAVKVLHPHLSGKEESRKRLAREAKAVARLQHPNILEVFDFGSPEQMDGFGGDYLVTEYIRGQTLREFIQSQKLDPPEIAAMVIHQLADALEHAHQTGVIHRDLKPENVMVREDGVLKLMDFGIAKILDRDERMTVTGALVGSPAHMAPEIIEGQEAGPCSDVFSLGTMLYLFATSELPFSGPNASATLRAIVEGQYQDPRARCPCLSDELTAIVHSCLCKEPSARCPDAGALKSKLATYLDSFGLLPVAPELASFFSHPEAYRTELRSRLTRRLVVRAEQNLSQKKTAQALSALSQALSLEPDDAQGLGLLRRTQTARARRRRLFWILKAFGAAVCLGLVLALAIWAFQHRPRRPALVHLDEEHGLASPPELDAAPPAALEADPGAPPAPAPAPSVRWHKAREAPPLPKMAELVVLVKPFGQVQLDFGPRSSAEAATHTLKTTAGRHRLWVGCHFCEDTLRTIDVKPGSQQVAIVPKLKPSMLSFDYEPPEARVRVGAEERAAKQTMSQPFLIKTPQGPKPGRHHVEYDISYPGRPNLHGAIDVEPGSSVTLHGRLSP